MSSRHSYLRTMCLFSLIALFSMALIGQIDGRLHIGGFDWDMLEEIAEEVNQSSTLSMSLTSLQSELDVIAGKFDAEARTTEIEQQEAVLATAMDSEQMDSEQTDSDSVSSSGTMVAVTQLPANEKPAPAQERERATIFIHKVASGENLWDISRSYGTTVNSIAANNNIQDPSRLRLGQELQILNVEGVLHTVARGETLSEIAQRYKVPMDEILKVNKITDPTRIQPNERLVIPGATRILKKDALVVNGQLQKAFDWPTRGRISSPFGPRNVSIGSSMHSGIDIAVPSGTLIRAAADGRVTYSGVNGGYGIMVMIDHGNRVETRYAHHSRNLVKVGDWVTRGQVIAHSGNTGISTGPHLHFEIRFRQQPMDPLKYLK